MDKSDKKPTAGAAESADDSDAAVQEELRHEAAERDAIGGDTATDRNVTGSSTWVTLADATPDGAADVPDAADGPGATGGSGST